jgi:transcriptional regulator GlxA family with amidase domain
MLTLSQHDGVLRQFIDVAVTESTDKHDSEAAFSRAFEELVGVPPSTWRRLRQNDAA